MGQPDIVFKHGTCYVAIFTKEVEQKGQVFQARSVSFQKRYRDKSGEWQTTSCLDVNDIPKMVLCLQKAYDFCTSMGHNDPDETP